MILMTIHAPGRGPTQPSPATLRWVNGPSERLSSRSGCRSTSTARSILSQALKDEHTDVHPCRIDGAGKARKRKMRDLPTAVDIHQMADAMPSQKYRMMALIAAGAGSVSGSWSSCAAETCSSSMMCRSGCGSAGRSPESTERSLSATPRAMRVSGTWVSLPTSVPSSSSTWTACPAMRTP